MADDPSPRRLSRAAIGIVAIILAMMLVIFVGRNVYHADTQRDEQAGRRDPAEAPKGPHDLQSEPVNQH